jgi:hypothetical protein
VEGIEVKELIQQNLEWKLKKKCVHFVRNLFKNVTTFCGSVSTILIHFLFDERVSTEIKMILNNLYNPKHKNTG